MSQLTENNLYNIKGAVESVPGVRPIVVREPTFGKWYVGAALVGEMREVEYGATARYEGSGFWYYGVATLCFATGMYAYDYLQELA